MELKKGQTIMMNIDVETAAATFHEAASIKLSMPPNDFALYHQSRKIEGDAALSSWGVKKDATIEVKTRGRGGGDKGQMPSRQTADNRRAAFENGSARSNSVQEPAELTGVAARMAAKKEEELHNPTKEQITPMGEAPGTHLSEKKYEYDKDLIEAKAAIKDNPYSFKRGQGEKRKDDTQFDQLNPGTPSRHKVDSAESGPGPVALEWGMTLGQFFEFMQYCMSVDPLNDKRSDKRDDKSPLVCGNGMTCWEVIKKAKVYELEPNAEVYICKSEKHVEGRFAPSVSAHALNKYFIKPWTAGKGRSVALLMQESLGKTQQPELMISHSWSEDMEQVYEMLMQALKDKVPLQGGKLTKDTVIWFCPLAQYQAEDIDELKLKKQLGGPKGPSPFDCVLQSEKVRDMFVLHTSTSDMYTRMWCVDELNTARLHGINIHMLASTTYIAPFMKEGTVAQPIDVRNAKCGGPNPVDDAKGLLDKMTSNNKGAIDEINKKITEMREKFMEQEKQKMATRRGPKFLDVVDEVGEGDMRFALESKEEYDEEENARLAPCVCCFFQDTFQLPPKVSHSRGSVIWTIQLPVPNEKSRNQFDDWVAKMQVGGVVATKKWLREISDEFEKYNVKDVLTFNPHTVSLETLRADVANFAGQVAKAVAASESSHLGAKEHAARLKAETSESREATLASNKSLQNELEQKGDKRMAQVKSEFQAPMQLKSPIPRGAVAIQSAVSNLSLGPSELLATCSSGLALRGIVPTWRRWSRECHYPLLETPKDEEIWVTFDPKA